MPKSKSIFGFKPGDQFSWRDPDDGACSRIGIIKSIRKIGGRDVALTSTECWFVEIPIHELKHLRPKAAKGTFRSK